MFALKEIKENLETVAAIRTITSVYQDIAQIRMNRIQEEVLKTRKFLEGLVKIYSFVKKSYIVSFKKKGGNEKKLEEILIRGKKKKVIVFLSTSEFFYGSLILDIWNNIRNYLKENKTDLMVIGRMGKYLTEGSGFGHKIFYFELDEEKPEKERVKEIIEFIRNYERIIVFHGRFETVVHQKSVQTDISGGSLLEKEVIELKDYLFEPSSEAVLEFFETEIVAALFNRVFLEHRLAKYAARMMAMYQATERADAMKEELEKEKRKLQRQLSNKTQIEFFGSSELWNQKMKT